MMDFKRSIQLILNERIISPFSGTFFFSWFVWNWKMLYYLLFPDNNLTLQGKLDFVNSNFINWNHNLLFPIYSTIFLIVLYPFVTTGSLWIWLLFKKWQADIKNKIEGAKLLRLDQSIHIRQQAQETEEKYANMLLDKDEEIKTKQMQVDTLTKELEEEKHKPRISLKARGKLEYKIREELLNSQLSPNALEEYTQIKFRGLGVSADLQKKLLNDIVNLGYSTVRDIDDAVNRAIHAVIAYEIENPNMFEAGTDYITKALGFVDSRFRLAHSFSQETMAAFNRYAQLVKPIPSSTKGQ